MRIKVCRFIFQSAERRPYLVVTILVLSMILLPAWIRPFQLPDEGRYAEVSRDMLVNGHWLQPELNNVPHLTKPPTYYAIAAVFMMIFGQNILAVRMVSLVAFLFGIFTMVGWSMRRGGARAAALTGLIGATLFQQAVMGQFADLNPLFTLWLTLGLLSFYEAIENPKNKIAWYGAWLFFALGFFTKGPPTLMVVFGTIIIYRILSGRAFRISFSRWFWGVALYLIISIPWYVWVLLLHGKLILSFWGMDIFERTVANKQESQGLPGYYLLVFLIGGAAWSFLALYEIIKKIRQGKSKGQGVISQSLQGRLRNVLKYLKALPPAQLWLGCWFGVTLLSFSLFLSTMLSYIQPAYPAFALMLGLYFAGQEKEHCNRRLHLTFSISVVLIILILWGGSLYGSYLVGSEHRKIVPEALSKDIEANRIASYLRSFRGKSFTMVQYRQFEEIFNFEAGRDSELLRSYVHHEWKSPENVEEGFKRLEKWIDDGQAIVLIMSAKKQDDSIKKILARLRPVLIGRRYLFYVSSGFGSLK